MKIVILGKKGESTAIVYHKLVEEFGEVFTIIEDSVSKKKLLKRRMEKLGFWKVFGQILFKVLEEPKIKKNSATRKFEILQEYGLSVEPDYEKSKGYHKVFSVNEDACLKLLQEIAPDIVVVNGTRIISERILNCIDAPFINTHMGITPKYRGVHGGYWALVENDRENCGVTVHKVDKGVDTGKILYQARIAPTKEDNLYTYQFLQAAAGVEMLIRAIQDFKEGGLKEQQENHLPSKLWSHPTIWEYRKNKKRGIS